MDGVQWKEEFVVVVVSVWVQCLYLPGICVSIDIIKAKTDGACVAG